VRAAAAAALIAGAAVGVGMGRSWPVVEAEPAGLQASVSDEDDYSLAGSYWELVDEAMDGAGEEELP
ncbi:MAG TPA: hypothetical protein VG477_15670, partial [Thermoanaerobaculia bacterium]|nr:hypothetical protein [Thermoanaerobaculia bacterium]